MGHSVFWWAASLGWACVIFVLSSLPESPVSTFDIPHLDKAFHFLEYAVLSLLLGLAMRRSSNPTLKARAALGAVALCALYALTDEFHQFFVPQRHPSLVDWLFDAGGASATQLLWRAGR